MKKNIIIVSVLIILLALGGLVFQLYETPAKNTPVSVTLLSPNGGETINIGSTFTIKWATENIPATDKISITIRRVPPPALQEEGQEFDPIVFINLDNTGSKEWVVSDMYPEGDYLLGITSYVSVPVTDPISDESDATFKIVKNVEAEKTIKPEITPVIKKPVQEEAKTPPSAKSPVVPVPPAVTTPNPPSTCIIAGQESASEDLCCKGLRRVFIYSYYSPTKSCSELSGFAVRTGTLSYICTNCGNKVCESWENRCNCPLDCIYP